MTEDSNPNIRFKIGDAEYEIPQVDDFDMDEWEIVYDYSGLIFDDFAPVDDSAAEAARERKTSQPAFWRALFHIAYRRANPDASVAEVKGITGQIKMNRAVVGTDDPPAMVTAQGSAPENSPSGNGSESNDSTTSSDAQASLDVPTGTLG